MARVPALLGRVVVPLVALRLRQRESLVHLLLARATRDGGADALLVDGVLLSYAELASKVRARARWLAARGVTKGDALALFGENSAEYVITLLGAAHAGAVTCLIHPELQGAFLAQTLERVAPRLILADPPLLERVEEATSWPVLSLGSARLEVATGSEAEQPRVGGIGADGFVDLFTSGTTGVPRAIRITHRRAVLSAVSFSALVHQLRTRDRLYCALPLHHASGLLLGLGACLAAGACLVLRQGFSARHFWDDVRRSRATVALYVGEMGRALLAQPASERDTDHPLLRLVGNGMAADVWKRVTMRFGVAQIREFYAATEFPGAIVNLTGTVGSVGHLPLERLRGYRLVKVDAQSGELVRDPRGRAVPCRVNEPGELVLRFRAEPGAATSPHRALGRDLFRSGDQYVRSGDRLRKDGAGQYFFVDRLGESFRFKGENVPVSEVEAALARVGGIAAAWVVGVRVPGVDGRPGLALLVPDGEIDWSAVVETTRALPRSARPCFVRLLRDVALTPSFKVKRRELADQGVDPETVPDPLLFRHQDRYQPLTTTAFRAITEGVIRL